MAIPSKRLIGLLCCTFTVSLAEDVTTAPLLIKPPRPVAAPQPLWAQNLRLIGVTAIEGALTAYFSSASSANVLAMSVGETLPSGLRLLRIENQDHPLQCHALVSLNAEHATIAMSDAHLVTPLVTTEPAPMQVETPKAQTPDEGRVAVRPWKKPAAR